MWEYKSVGILFDINEVVKNIKWVIWECAKKSGRCVIEGRGMMAISAYIAFMMNTMSFILSKAGPLQWMDVIHIMRYLKSNMDFKLWLISKNISLRVFCNAGWVGDANNQRSLRDFFFVVVEIILWKCKKHLAILTFTMTPKYMATSHCIKEVVWLRQHVENVGYKQKIPKCVTIKDA